MVMSESTIATSTAARTPNARSMSCDADMPRRTASTSDMITKPDSGGFAVIPLQLGERDLGVAAQRGDRAGRDPLVVDAHLPAAALRTGQNDAGRPVELAELRERPVRHGRDVLTDRACATGRDVLQQLLEPAPATGQHAAVGDETQREHQPLEPVPVVDVGDRGLDLDQTAVAVQHSEHGGECWPGRRTASVSMPRA